jgi:uncharacterized protein YdeI (BOF family)
MLSRFKNFCKDKQSDLFIIITIILVTLISFGIGRLTTPKTEPIQIKNLEKASVEDISGEQSSSAASDAAAEDKGNYQGQVVGSKNSDKYHLPDCPGAKQISEQNKIWFNSTAEAEKAGYKPASNCPRLAK